MVAEAWLVPLIVSWMQTMASQPNVDSKTYSALRLCLTLAYTNLWNVYITKLKYCGELYAPTHPFPSSCKTTLKADTGPTTTHQLLSRWNTSLGSKELKKSTRTTIPLSVSTAKDDIRFSVCNKNGDSVGCLYACRSLTPYLAEAHLKVISYLPNLHNMC